MNTRPPADRLAKGADLGATRPEVPYGGETVPPGGVPRPMEAPLGAPSSSRLVAMAGDGEVEEAPPTAVRPVFPRAEEHAPRMRLVEGESLQKAIIDASSMAGWKEPYFAEMDLHSPMEGLIERYSDWLLGQGAYPGLRKERLEAGIPSFLGRPDLRDGAAYASPLASLLVSAGDGEWSAALAFRTPCGRDSFGLSEVTEGPDGRRVSTARIVQWRHQITLTRLDADTVRLRHGIAMKHPPIPWDVTIYPPRIVSELSASGLAKQTPEAKLLRVAQGGETDFVRHILLDPAREIPVVVVSHGMAPGIGPRTFVDPERLAKQLQGLAQVYLLDPAPRGNDFTSAMFRAGFSEKYGCYAGGVRLYQPFLDKADPIGQHPLWPSQFFEKIPRAAARIATDIGCKAAQNRMPLNFLSHTARAFHGRLRDHAKEVIQDSMAGIQAIDQGLESRLRSEIVDLNGQVGYAFSQAEEAHVEKERLETEARGLRSQMESLEHQIQEMAAAKAEAQANQAIPHDIFDLLFERKAPLSLSLGLEFVQQHLPDRVYVHPDALRGAREFETRFKGTYSPERAWELLLALCTSGWKCLTGVEDGGASRLEQLIPKGNLVLRETDDIKNMPEAEQARLMRYQPKGLDRPLNYVAWPHLKQGAWRMYFAYSWDPFVEASRSLSPKAVAVLQKDRRILIRHSGDHLRHKSFSI